ncbi:MAG: endonuclease III [Candidatus Bathyarchaeota archaeon]|nr:MAG: endonuclease III [Candidatus Bathyarchaeota archaeon]
MDNKGRVREIINLLEGEYPNARISLHFNSSLELLVSTILSAQSTDRIVNEVTKNLFKKYKVARDYANADLAELENNVRSTGFYRRKALYLKKLGKMLVDRFDSEVPQTMEELVTLPGVARKTANIVLSTAFNTIEGIAVDTHVKRLAQRLGLSNNKDPNKIEEDLMRLVPKEQWPKLTDLLIFHGRRICNARKPNCEECVINELCPSAFTIKR